MEIGQATHVGRRRARNEDSLAVAEQPRRPDRGVLCAVADGMGGHAAGHVASRLAVETVVQSYFEAGGEARTALAAAVQQANLAVWREAGADPARQGMGTTLVCAALLGRRALLANVGDSRAYLVAGPVVRQLTRDHTWVADQVAQGRLSAEAAERHPYRNVLTRSLGELQEVEVDLFELELEPGAALLLCSDGLTRHVEPEAIRAVVVAEPPQRAAERLVALANERGGTDNVSVIVVRT